MDNSVDSDLIRGNIDTIILNALCDKDRYGLEIIDEIEKKSHGSYQIKQPTLYSALTRLEKLGYVIKYSGDSPIGAKRAYFSITDQGRDFLKKNREEWAYSRVVIEQLISNTPVENSDEFETMISNAEIEPSPVLSSSETVSDEESNEKINKDALEPTIDEKPSKEDSYVPDSELFKESNELDKSSSLYEFVNKPDNPSDIINGQSIDEIILGSITSNAPISVTAESIIEESLNTQETKNTAREEEQIEPQANNEYVDVIGAILSAPPPVAEEIIEDEKPIEPQPNKREQMTLDLESILADTRPTKPVESTENIDSAMSSFLDKSPEPEKIKPLPIKPRSFMNFDELSESVSASGDTLIVRRYDPQTEKDYNDKYYIYSNKFYLFFYSILFGAMFLEIFVPYLILNVFTNISTLPGNLPVLIISILIAGVLPFVATVRFLKEPFKKVRYYADKTSTIIAKFSIFFLLLLSIYAINVLFQMDLAFQPEYLFTVITPALLATNIPISTFIQDAMYKSRYFAKM